MVSRSLSSSPLVFCVLLAGACFDGKDSGGQVDTAGEADSGGDSDTGGEDTAGAGDGGTTTDVGEVCAAYVDAISTCYESAGLDVSSLGLGDDFCEVYTDPVYLPYFECYIEVINAADCTTTAGITALSTAAATCSGS